MKFSKLLSLAALLPAELFAQDKVLLPVGDEAPDFTLISEKGDTITLSTFRGTHPVVLIFYPGDETPVCTRQLCEIRDNYAIFEQKGAVVFGVNPAGEQSHQQFVAKHAFKFSLLIDTDKKVAKTYGTYSRMMQKRTVYVIDINGKIAFAQRGKPTVEEILKAIE